MGHTSTSEMRATSAMRRSHIVAATLIERVYHHGKRPRIRSAGSLQ